MNVSALADIDEKFGSLPEGDLENIIDPTNIHGWLQDKIAIVERRIAYFAKNLKEGKILFKIMLEKLGPVADKLIRNGMLDINYILYCGEENLNNME